MKKTFTILIAALMLLTMISQPTRSWGQERGFTAAYTLTPETNSASASSAYNSGYDFEIDDITWNVTGNTSVNPWRIGGKKSTIGSNGTGDRPLYSKNVISDNISKIVITHGNSSSDITVNSITLIVSTAQNGGGEVISSLTGSYTNNTTTIFERPNDKDWSGRYYKIVYNVTNTTTTQKYVMFSQAVFYKTTYNLTYTATSIGGNISVTDNDDNEVESGTALEPGTELIVQATANLGYDFDYWTVTGSGSSVEDEHEPYTIFTLGTDNATLSANFTSAGPSLTVSTTELSGFTYSHGNGPSAAQSFTVSGASLSDNIVIQAPTDYEIRQGTTGEFGSSISLTPSSETVSSTTIYVRLKAGKDIGTYNSENISITSTDATGKTVTLSGSVTGYSVTYNGNGNTGGSVPTDSKAYTKNETVTVKSNSGSLVRTGYTYGGWNTKDDGMGNNYTAGTGTFNITTNTILYAKWSINTHAYTLTKTGETEHAAVQLKNGDVVIGASETIPYNTEVTIDVTPEDGYGYTVSVKDSEDNEVTVTDNKFYMPDNTVTVMVNVVRLFAITTSATHGTIGVYQSSKPAGDTVRLKVTPNSGYALVGLKIKRTSGSSVTDIVPTYNPDLKRYIFTMPDYDVTVKGVFDATNEVTYDFSDIDFSEWDNQYGEHTVKYSDATVTFASASKQNSGSTIDDIPVTKGGDVSLVMKTVGGVTKKITGATFVCRQWGTKTQTITFHSSKNTGSTYQTYDGLTSTNFTISNDTLRSGVDAVKITFSSSSNQVGIESATILIKGDAHSITCATGLPGGSISSSPTSASQGETVELTATPDAEKALDSWTVTYTAGEEIFSIPVTDNKFTMPNFAVNVTASFRSARDLTVQYSINGTINNDLEQKVKEGESVDIKGIPVGVTPTGYTFAGWSANASDLSTLLAADDSYTPSDNVTLYAVFTATKPAPFTLSITTSDFNSTSYAANNNEKTTAANAVSGETMDVKWTSYQVMQSGGMQWQKDNGYIYNSTDLGTIKSFTVTSSEGSFTTLYGTSENDGCSSSTVGNGYFKTRVGGATGKTSEVKVTFVKSITRKFTRIISENEDINTTVTLTAPAIIESGKTLTIEDGGILNAGNYLTIDGGTLVIEDGGQLILSDDASVQATVKNSTAASTETKTYDIQWNAISSPVDNVVVTSFVKGDTHNVYRYDEKTVYWQEYRGTNGFNNLQNGRGYIYRSTESGIEFQGEVITGTVSCADYLSYACDNNRYIGFNLIGNPFTHDITWSNLTTKTNISSAGFFLLGADGNWSARTTSGTIAPMQAFLVQATEESPVINISNTAGKGDDRYGNDQIQFTVNNSEYSDVAYAIFREGHGLNKIEHRNDNIPMLYIINDDKDYAIAEMPDNTNVINLGFKARAIGQYTLSLNAEGRYSYMHLYDKLTGSDVDMLLDNSYTFVGSPSDRNDRFVLRLNYNAANIDTESDIFAYQNGADIIISGTGELQIFDIMGHQVSTQRINGVETINVSTQGVYILRLVGTEIKTQKIVVR